MRDQLSIDRVNKTHPKARGTFKLFIETAEAELGITLRVTHGYRTRAEQDALYAQGRTAPGKKVTNAKGGQSYHNYGLAIDVVPMKDNKPQWDYDYSKLAAIAKRYNIAWGGDFKSLPDKPHFEITFGFKTSQLADITADRLGYPMI